ncbi:MAG TPA: hypothetical protein VFS56_10505 [Gemmatimonadaceae bacterium]|nr:hypothetical protein [Gemmatimonadaceae bacterium]
MLHTSVMRTVILIALLAVAAVTAAATLFFAYFGVQLVYHALLTPDGETSVGHVYVQVGAVLYPLLGLVSGGIAFVSWRAFRRRLRLGQGT